jgi:hypothetical protein
VDAVATSVRRRNVVLDRPTQTSAILLEQPGVRAALRSPLTEPADRVRPSAPLVAGGMRSIGGFGLVLMGALAAVSQVGNVLQAGGGPSGAWALIGLVILAGLYAVPYVVLGIAIWRGSIGSVAVLIGLALAVISVFQLTVGAGPIVLLPLATSAALAFGLLAPTRRAI